MSTVATSNNATSNDATSTTGRPEAHDDHALANLSQRIRAKLDDVDTYLDAACGQRDRLVYVTIIGGSVAAALTAPPALGGKTFSDWLGTTFGLDAPAWQILCLLAMIFSLAATIATQLSRSKGFEASIARAQQARCLLETLDVGIALGHFNRGDATNRYLECLEDIPFIDTRRPRTPRGFPTGDSTQRPGAVASRRGR